MDRYLATDLEEVDREKLVISELPAEAQTKLKVIQTLLEPSGQRSCAFGSALLMVKDFEKGQRN